MKRNKPLLFIFILLSFFSVFFVNAKIENGQACARIQNSVDDTSNLSQLLIQVENIDESVNDLNDRILEVENTIDQLSLSEPVTSDWNYVTFIDQNNDTIKPFYLSGNEVRLRWSYSADTSEAGVIFQLYYENGTLLRAHIVLENVLEFDDVIEYWISGFFDLIGFTSLFFSVALIIDKFKDSKGIS